MGHNEREKREKNRERGKLRKKGKIKKKERERERERKKERKRERKKRKKEEIFSNFGFFCSLSFLASPVIPRQQPAVGRKKGKSNKRNFDPW